MSPVLWVSANVTVMLAISFSERHGVALGLSDGEGAISNRTHLGECSTYIRDHNLTAPMHTDTAASGSA
ncbi:MAG: hypothetical protein ACFB2W_03675 [Leptolyngbyaceae cyanobacterium]